MFRIVATSLRQFNRGLQLLTRAKCNELNIEQKLILLYKITPYFIPTPNVYIRSSKTDSIYIFLVLSLTEYPLGVCLKNMSQFHNLFISSRRAWGRPRAGGDGCRRAPPAPVWARLEINANT